MTKGISRIAAGALLVGVATFASAQTRAIGAQGFAERFAELQALSSNSAQFQRPTAPASSVRTPSGRASFAETFARQQAAASNSGAFMSSVVADEMPNASAQPSAEVQEPGIARRLANMLHRGADARGRSTY